MADAFRKARLPAGPLLAKDKKLQWSAGETSVFVANLGRRVLVFDDNEVVALLWAAVKREGGQSNFAKRHGVERGRLNRTLAASCPWEGLWQRPLGSAGCTPPNNTATVRS
jgi:hypothetical protein